MANSSAPVDEALQSELARASAYLQTAQYREAVELLEGLIESRGTDPRITGRLAAARALFFQQEGRERQQQRVSGPAPDPVAPIRVVAPPSSPSGRVTPPLPSVALCRPRRTIPEGMPLPPPPVTVPLDEPLHQVETCSEAIAVFGPPLGVVEAEPSGPSLAPVLADVIPLHPRRRGPSPTPVPADEPLYIEHFRGGLGAFDPDDERTPTRERVQWHQRALELPAAAVDPVVAKPTPASDEAWPALALAPLRAVDAPRARPRAAAFMVAASLCSVLVAGSAVALVTTRQLREQRAPVTRVKTTERAGVVLLAAGEQMTAELQAAARRRSAHPPVVAAPTGARLRVLVSPPEAEAVVTFRGTPQAGNRFEQSNLPTGTRPETVTVTAPGFAPATLSVTLDRDQDLQVKLRRPVKRMRLFPL
jgi:hypothetical protein